jgi:hypothetical protein
MVNRNGYIHVPCKYHHGCNVANHPCQHVDRKTGEVCGWSPESKAENEGSENTLHPAQLTLDGNLQLVMEGYR